MYIDTNNFCMYKTIQYKILTGYFFCNKKHKIPSTHFIESNKLLF